jgi:hypothetical protein
MQRKKVIWKSFASYRLGKMEWFVPREAGCAGIESVFGMARRAMNRPASKTQTSRPKNLRREGGAGNGFEQRSSLLRFIEW